MQEISEEFKESIRNTNEIRNRGYIKAVVGIINQEAQDHFMIDKSKCELAYFSNENDNFDLIEPIKPYATLEKDFSHVDGSMYFPPREENKDNLKFYNNGIVSKNLLGNIYIYFGQESKYDIKGMTINFGECYPTELTVEYDEGIRTYKNDKSEWQTEDVFSNVSFFNIKPIKMVNEYGRLRILEFACGVIKKFTNDKVIQCQSVEYVSPISDTISSQDLSLEVDNRDLYFDADDETSAIAFMETGQEVKILYGYDVDNTGTIEWIPAQKCYMSKWRATDKTIEFFATDRFALMEEKYYKGIYRESGINLYDLAVDVLKDAGIKENQYILDSCLKNIVVYNPVPPVAHREALQMIANAGMCKLYQGRDGKIHIKSDIVPQKKISTNDISEFSEIEDVLNPETKYGYESRSLSDDEGNFEVNPEITISFDRAFSCDGMMINFEDVKPQKFKVKTYLENVPIQTVTIENPLMDCAIQKTFNEFDKMDIEFVKAQPNEKISVRNVMVGNYTDYHISNNCMTKQPEREKQLKVKSINMNVFNLSEGNEKKDIVSEKLVLNKDTKEYTAYFNTPSYGFEVSVGENSQIICKIKEYSAYYVKVSFEGIRNETAVELKITGYEYSQNIRKYDVPYDEHGEIIEWNNPLISSNAHAKEVEEWLASYFLGSVDYNIDWWGDPTTDVGDLFYFTTPKGKEVLIKSYENTLNFSKGWSGAMKARRVVLE